jgi:cathepsin F
MMTVLQVSLLAILAHVILAQNDESDSRWQKYMNKYNRKYKDNKSERKKRYANFLENNDRLEQLRNMTKSHKWDKQINPADEAQFDDNEFSDMSPEEFANTFLTLRISDNDVMRAQAPSAENFVTTAEEEDHHLRFLQTVATSYDWRTKGAVGVVKNQGSCGSCYTFAVAANLEGQYYIKNKKMINLSEQQILNCDKYDYGCNGGMMANTYKYLMGSSGLGLTSSLKYVAVKQTCTAITPAVKVTGYKFAGSTVDATIAAFLVKTGPLAAAVNANYFQSYRSGVLRLSNSVCNPNGTNHAITLVGYGQSNGVNYWIIKNSWGAAWGESGYIRLAWGTCGINTYVLTGLIA